MEFLDFLQQNAKNWKNPKFDKRKRKQSPERAVMKQIYKYLLAKDFLVLQINSSVLNSPDSNMPLHSYYILNTGASSGVADLVAIKDSKVLFIEVKAPSGRQTETQKQFEQLCKRFNTHYIIARSVEDVESYLEQTKLFVN